MGRLHGPSMYLVLLYMLVYCPSVRLYTDA